MIAAAGARPPLWPALGAVAAAAGFAYLLLEAEGQWQVAVLGAVVVALLAWSARARLLDRVEASWRAHGRLAGGAALAAALAVMAALHGNHFALLMAATVMLYAIACLGLTVQFGFAGVVNFAGAAFFGTGAYTAAVTATHTALPHLLVVLLGGALAALIGSLLLLPILRTRGHYAALITIAFGILFRTFLEVNDTLGGPQGLKVPGLAVAGWSFNTSIELSGGREISFYLGYALLALLLLAAALVLVRRLERSWLGLSLDAVREDEIAAAVFGLSVARWKILAFTLGNFLVGVAGALYAMMTGFVAPASFTLGDSLILVSIVLLGGIGNPIGALAAAAIVLVLPEKLQAIQEYRFLLFSLLVILILLFRPGGLLPRRLRDYFPAGRAS